MNNIITIDGPAASGKTSAGVSLANKLDFQFIDSGSIYRAGCLYLLRHNLPTDDMSASDIFRRLDLSFSSLNDNYKVFLFDEDISDELLSREVTELVPVVGGRKMVREVVKDKQKELVFGRDTIITGRDVGSEIFPNATIKFFVYANPETRALRKTLQLQGIGVETDYEKVLASINYRDTLDTTREVSPFRMPDSSIVIDTSNMILDEVVSTMFSNALELLEYNKNREGQNKLHRELL